MKYKKIETETIIYIKENHINERKYKFKFIRYFK